MSTFHANPDWLRRLSAAVDAGLTDAALVAATEAEESFGTSHGGVPSQPGSPPNSQTGHLRNSIAYASPQSLGTPGHAAFGTNVPYGRYLENGATVTAKRTKYLPVPVNQPAKDMLRRLNGISLRFTWFSGKGSRLVVQRAKTGALLLVEQTATGREKKRGAVFILKRSITIRPRPWILRAANAAKPRMMAAFAQTVRRTLGTP